MSLVNVEIVKIEPENGFTGVFFTNIYYVNPFTKRARRNVLELSTRLSFEYSKEKMLDVTREFCIEHGHQINKIKFK